MNARGWAVSALKQLLNSESKAIGSEQRRGIERGQSANDFEISRMDSHQDDRAQQPPRELWFLLVLESICQKAVQPEDHYSFHFSVVWQ